MDVVEATQSEHWSRHLHDDVNHANKLGKRRLVGFIFVAWAKAPKPDALTKYREAFQTLGVPPESIEFVFRQQLVAELRQPAFARVWKELLRLPPACYPFELIEDAAIVGQMGDKSLFAPTLEEYREARVHRPSLATEVEDRLAKKGWALVRGVGAAGKTVLGAQIGLSRHGSGDIDQVPGLRYRNPVYYLDLAAYTGDVAQLDVRSVLEVVTCTADRNVLFILDNVHVDEGAATKIFDHWEKCRCGSQLLMLERLTTRAPDPKGRARPLASLETDCLELTVGPEDLAGVFVWRFSRLRPNVRPQEPPAAARSEWHGLFGEDLIAFVVAVTRRISDLAGGDWQLAPEDAVEHVRRSYLDTPTTVTEGTNLMRVAALSRLEVEAPKEVLEGDGLSGSLRIGLVRRVKRGDFERFYLHPGMGRLLLATQGVNLNEMGLLLEVAGRSPSCGMVIAARLEYLGRDDDAVKVLRSIESGSTLTQAILTPGLHYALAGCRRFDRLKVLDCQRLDERLSGQKAALRLGLARSPLDSIPSFINYAKGKLPKLKGVVEGLLEEPAVIEELARLACSSPWGGLLGFLRSSPRAEAVVAKINKSRWECEQLSRRPKEADSVFDLVQQLGTLRRHELKNALALALVRNPELPLWNAAGVGLHQLGATLMLAKAVETEQKVHFLEAVIKKEWLQEQYARKATVGGVAAMLYSLWGYQEEDVRSHFRIPELNERVRREVVDLGSRNGKQLFEAIQLLGCAALFGVSTDYTIQWPSDQQIEKALGAQSYKEKREDIGNIQAQLWLGLRETARRRGVPRVRVSADEGEQLLDMWKRSHGPTDRHKILNALMVEWLEECMKADWYLQPDSVALQELVARAEEVTASGCPKASG
jgi:hypothetical protein